MNQSVTRARQLRRSSTEAERLLWRHLRNRQTTGCKIRRQYAIGPYIVDFVCLEKRLIIEIDGGQHGKHRTGDRERTAWLESQRFRLLRFWNNDVINETPGVLSAIQQALSKD